MARALIHLLEGPKGVDRVLLVREMRARRVTKVNNNYDWVAMGTCLVGAAHRRQDTRPPVHQVRLNW